MIRQQYSGITQSPRISDRTAACINLLRSKCRETFIQQTPFKLKKEQKGHTPHFLPYFYILLYLFISHLILSYIFIYFYTLKIRTGDCLQAVCKSQLSDPPSLCQVQNWPIGTDPAPKKEIWLSAFDK